MMTRGDKEAIEGQVTFFNTIFLYMHINELNEHAYKL
jgi:hypothetical protein